MLGYWAVGFLKIEATSAARRQAGGKLREEPVCNQGIGKPIVHTPVWTTWLCTGGRGYNPRFFLCRGRRSWPRQLTAPAARNGRRKLADIN